MRHLVTGGSGFLGHLLIERLVRDEHDVIGFDIHPESNPVNGAKYIIADVTDVQAVEAVMAQNIDVVHHTAALVPLTKAGERFETVNVGGTRIVAEAAGKAGVSAFVFTSSSAIFGAPPCPVTADTPCHPLEIYGRSKLEAERAAMEIAKKYGMAFIAIRPRTIIAAGRLGIFQVLFDWISQDVDIYVIGSGRNKIQFLHADDLIDCHMRLLAQKRYGIFNVGTSEFGTLQDDLETLIAHARSKSRVRHLPASLARVGLGILDRLHLSPLAPWHYLTYGEDFYFDLSPLEEIGFKCKYSNTQMLIQAYDSFVASKGADTESKDHASRHRSPIQQGILLGLIKALSRRPGS